MVTDEFRASYLRRAACFERLAERDICWSMDATRRDVARSHARAAGDLLVYARYYRMMAEASSSADVARLLRSLCRLSGADQRMSADSEAE